MRKRKKGQVGQKGPISLISRLFPVAGLRVQTIALPTELGLQLSRFQATPDRTLYAATARAHGDGVDLRRPEGPRKAAQQLPGDPPLQAVVAKGWELGTRGQPDARTPLSAAWFRSDLHHDLQFVSSGGRRPMPAISSNIRLTPPPGPCGAVGRPTGRPVVELALHLAGRDLPQRLPGGPQPLAGRRGRGDRGQTGRPPALLAPPQPECAAGLVTDGAVGTGGHTAAGQCTGGTRRKR